MRIPWWLLLLLGFSLINTFLPDPIPVVDELVPLLIGVVFLIRLFAKQKFYKTQYQQYKQYQQGQTGAGGSGAAGGAGAGQSSSSFYSRFRNWNAGFQAPPGSGPQKDPHDVLGVRRGASMDEVKKAYRDQLKKFHPDKIESLKLDPEYREMFEEKTREIQKAYEALGGT
jgi:DnaJ-domain-containing protein 1